MARSELGSEHGPRQGENVNENLRGPILAGQIRNPAEFVRIIENPDEWVDFDPQNWRDYSRQAKNILHIRSAQHTSKEMRQEMKPAATPQSMPQIQDFRDFRKAYLPG
ncbi:hypothetical protein DdX_14323 [Ditylenchus destructor]|uniref:Uncharacterized protein n=1 Tax=Ditylenchus destructor TaxID=166010 RepID=A0AAD4MSY6_9BILA|nr:hypothetical protein DdX_14323 [Ditylenchus destructor]